MKIPKEFRPLAKAARRQRWTISQTGSSHLRWTSPTGEKVYSTSTPSDWRALQNVMRDLRQKGLIL